MSLELKNATSSDQAQPSDFLTAAFLFTIPTDAKGPGQATFRNLGTVGNWYVKFNGKTPSAVDYDVILFPGAAIGQGDIFTELDPPKGDVKAICDATADGNLSWYTSWRECP